MFFYYLPFSPSVWEQNCRSQSCNLRTKSSLYMHATDHFLLFVVLVVMKARNAHLIIYKLDTSNQLCLQTLQLLFIRK